MFTQKEIRMIEHKDTPEVRTLKWKLKTLAKQNGKQGATIFTLRNENAALREAVTIDRGAYQRNLERLRAAEAEVRVLREKLADQAWQADR